MTVPFSLRIFVADGDPDGLRIVDKSNWIGNALVFPRALLPQVKARPRAGANRGVLAAGPAPSALSHMKTENGYFLLWIKHLASHAPVHAGLQL